MELTSKRLGFFVFIAMVLHVVKGCPDGWNEHGDTCYHFSHDVETFTGAKTICHDIGGTLVEIEDAQENAYLASVAKSNSVTYRIALTDLVKEGTWIWYESNTPVTYNNWSGGQPDGHTNQNCALIGLYGHWFDHNCHDAIHYICEMAPVKSVVNIVG